MSCLLEINAQTQQTPVVIKTQLGGGLPVFHNYIQKSCIYTAFLTSKGKTPSLVETMVLSWVLLPFPTGLHASTDLYVMIDCGLTVTFWSSEY